MANLELKQLVGGLNSDDSDVVVPKNDYRNAINCRVLSTENGKQGSVLNIRGNAQVGADLTAITGKPGAFKTVGSYEDEENSCIYDLVANSEGHHLLVKRNQAGSVVLLDNDQFVKDGVNTGLALDKTKPVTSLAKVGDTLFWANGIPRRINVKHLQDGKYTVFNDDLVSVIRRPPDLPPMWQKTTTGTDGTVSLLKDAAFQFTWRFVYLDGETSVFSPYSTVVNYPTEKDTNDTIAITLPVDVNIPESVRFVELAYRSGNTGNLFIIKRWDANNMDDAEAIAEHNAGTGLSYYFLNDSAGQAVDTGQATKLSDAVPLTSEALEAAGNRIFLGNNKLGYDTPGATSLSLSTHSVTVDVNGQTITGYWYYWIRTYGHSGNKHHYYAWVLYVTGYDGIKDGYYAVDGLQGSESPIFVSDDLNFDFAYPATVEFSDMHQADASTASKDPWTKIRLYYGQPSTSTSRHLEPVNHNPNSAIVVGAPTQTDFKPVQVFKSGSRYRMGIVLYDRYLRSSAVVTNDSGRIATPGTSFSNETYVDRLIWQLNNGNAVNEIPAWAEYYAVVTTLNLKTRYFLQTFPYEISYVDKDDDGAYQTKKEAYNPTFAGIQIDITSLSKDGLGYVFNRGDVVDLYLESGKSLSLSVIDQYGKYIVCSLADIGDTTDTPAALMELYTPYKASASEIYYEVGQMFQINSPGTDNRNYSVLSGGISGDTWIISRKHSDISTNGVEAMNSNDKHFSEWLTDQGRVNTIPQPGIGQALKTVNVVYSDQYIPQTLINGLSSFSAINTKDIPDSCGPIRKLVYTSKVEGQQGGVMLAICENETASIYLGETQISTQTGDNFLAASPGVIGTVNVLKGSYGTVNPESVVEKDGRVYFLCLRRGKVIRYASNGLFPISDYKMKDWFNTRCKDIQALTPDQLSDFGYDNIQIPAGYDAQNDEYLVFMPRVRELPDFLEDITRNKYSFELAGQDGTPVYTDTTELNKLCFYSGRIVSDIPVTVSVSYEGQVLIDNKPLTVEGLDIPAFRPKTSNRKFSVTATGGNITIAINQLQPNYHVFDDGQESVLGFKEGVDRWTGKYFFQPDGFGTIDNILYSFFEGNFYQHNAGDNFNTFYGERFPSLISVAANENPVRPKTFGSLSVYGSQAPDYVHIRTSRPWSGGIFHQSSYMPKERFKAEEGLFYGVFYFDRISPNSPGATYEAKMLYGDRMRGKTGNIFVEYDEYQNAIEVSTIGVKYDLSSGHVFR